LVGCFNELKPRTPCKNYAAVTRSSGCYFEASLNSPSPEEPFKILHWILHENTSILPLAISQPCVG
jgi:hypothetical protein